MEPSQAQHESPAKGAGSELPSNTMSRFRDLAARLFRINATKFRTGAEADKTARAVQRQTKRGPPK